MYLSVEGKRNLWSKITTRENRNVKPQGFLFNGREVHSFLTRSGGMDVGNSLVTCDICCARPHMKVPDYLSKTLLPKGIIFQSIENKLRGDVTCTL